MPNYWYGWRTAIHVAQMVQATTSAHSDCGGPIIALLLGGAFGIRLDRSQLPEGNARGGLFRVIERTQQVLSLNGVLRLLHLSAARYHYWKRAA
jgi:hypothetical protein